MIRVRSKTGTSDNRDIFYLVVFTPVLFGSTGTCGKLRT